MVALAVPGWVAPTHDPRSFEKFSPDRPTQVQSAGEPGAHPTSLTLEVPLLTELVGTAHREAVPTWWARRAGQHRSEYTVATRRRVPGPRSQARSRLQRRGAHGRHDNRSPVAPRSGAGHHRRRSALPWQPPLMISDLPAFGGGWSSDGARRGRGRDGGPRPRRAQGPAALPGEITAGGSGSETAGGCADVMLGPVAILDSTSVSVAIPRLPVNHFCIDCDSELDQWVCQRCQVNWRAPRPHRQVAVTGRRPSDHQPVRSGACVPADR